MLNLTFLVHVRIRYPCELDLSFHQSPLHSSEFVIPLTHTTSSRLACRPHTPALPPSEQVSYNALLANRTRRRNPLKNYELFTLPLPFVLWYIVFRDPVLGFWPTLSLSAVILFVV